MVAVNGFPLEAHLRQRCSRSWSPHLRLMSMHPERSFHRRRSGAGRGDRPLAWRLGPRDRERVREPGAFTLATSGHVSTSPASRQRHSRGCFRAISPYSRGKTCALTRKALTWAPGAGAGRVVETRLGESNIGQIRELTFAAHRKALIPMYVCSMELFVWKLHPKLEA
jgi:hypothetical protein